MKHSQLDAMLAESGLDPDDVDQLSSVLGPLVELSGEVPAPSSELLALFGEDATGSVRSKQHRVVSIRRARNHSLVAGAVVLALSGVGATGLSAAANTLPSPWQHQVSDFSHRYLPFDFPEPTVKIPHLAVTPGHEALVPDAGVSGDGLGAGVHEERLRNAERISRSLVHARPDAKGDAPTVSDRGPDRSSEQGPHTFGARSSGPVESTGPSAPSPSPAPAASDSAPGRPNADKWSHPTYAPAVPVKTAPYRPGPGTGGPDTEGRPGKGPGGPVKVGPVLDPETGAATPPGTGPDPVSPAPEVPGTGIPVEGGPALDRVTPDVESDAGDS